MRFLLIDSLCIIQDSTNDKLHEINSMGDIYKNSTATITAANARQVEDGFLSNRSPLDLCPIPVDLEPNVFGAAYLAKNKDLRMRTIKLDDPLFSRGWAFQEFLLSPRVLWSDSRQVTLSCRDSLYKGLHSDVVNSKYMGKELFSAVDRMRYQPDHLRTKILSVLSGEIWSRNIVLAILQKSKTDFQQ